MTNPVILLGTQSNGETLPVQVDPTGRLVAEGLQGPQGDPGEQGPPGDPGQPGGDFPLPADPYEGAVLGWLNGGLAWVGEPPIPIPPGVFGPITSWDSANGILTFDGDIPEGLGPGVYVWQCNADGSLYTEGFDVSTDWVSKFSGPSVGWSGAYPLSNGFDGDRLSLANANGVGGTGIFTPNFGNGTYQVKAKLGNSVLYQGCEVDGVGPTSLETGNTLAVWDGLTSFNTLQMSADGLPNNARVCFEYIEVNGYLLVQPSQSIRFRIDSIQGNAMYGVKYGDAEFTVGKYLNITAQRVAPRVLYGNDPTSLIDYLRSS